EESRALLIADFCDYAVACTHLSLTEADAVSSAAIIREEAAAMAPKPLILMGDMNSLPTSAVVDSLKRDFRVVNRMDRPTYPASAPADCIDYIMVANSPRLHVESVSVVNDSVSSDHRPLVADIVIPAAADALMWHKPYIQNVSPDGATVMFQTRRPARSSVEFGTDTTHLRSSRQLYGGQEVVHSLEHKVRLDSLEPGTTCFYRVRAQEILSNHAYSKSFGNETVTPFYSFTVPETDSEDFTAIIFNDLHNYRPTINAMAAIARGIPHDLVIFNGDCLSEPGSAEDAIEEIHYLADAFDLAEIPAVFIRGNHEIRNAYSSGMPTLFDRPGERTYGAFTLGGIRFVTLDCGEDKPDDTWVYYGLNDFTALRGEQAEFLKAELRSKDYRKADRRVLIHHIPVWGNTDEYRPCTALWAPILTKYGKFDVNIVGHTHEYNHLSPNAVGNPWPVVVGGGPRRDAATMMVLEKRGKSLTLRVLNSEDEEIDRLAL
ncbi:MAG: metallophosphoesterase, partial [Muribaculaceae bacterium]|nr:metallophosphoesterase [Muribaculaceae bacterium]